MDDELELARDAGFHVEDDRAALAGGQRRDLRDGGARLRDGQRRRVGFAHVLHHHTKAHDGRLAVDDALCRVGIDVQQQRAGSILRGDGYLVGDDAHVFAAAVAAGDGHAQRRILRGRPFDFLFVGGARAQLHAGERHSAVAQRRRQARVGLAARVLERHGQGDLLARIHVLGVLGRQGRLKPILRDGDGLAGHVGNGQRLLGIRRLIGDGRLAHQLLAAHGERVGEGHLLAHGQGRLRQLLLGDAVVLDHDVAQLDIAGVGERVGQGHALSLARAGRGDAVRRRQLRRSLLGLDGHRHGSGGLLRAAARIDHILNIVADLALFDLVLRHMPLAGVRHALLALEAAVFFDRNPLRVEERDLLLHVRLAAVVDLDGNGNILLGDHRLRFTQRGHADRIRIRSRRAAQRQHQQGKQRRDSKPEAFHALLHSYVQGRTRGPFLPSPAEFSADLCRKRTQIHFGLL